MQLSFKTALEQEDWTVLMPADADAVLELIRSDPSRVDLLITNPGEDFEAGLQLIVSANECAPTLPIVTTTSAGYPIGVQQGFALLLEPVSPDELMDAVRQLVPQ